MRQPCHPLRNIAAAAPTPNRPKPAVNRLFDASWATNSFTDIVFCKLRSHTEESLKIHLFWNDDEINEVIITSAAVTSMHTFQCIGNSYGRHIMTFAFSENCQIEHTHTHKLDVGHIEFEMSLFAPKHMVARVDRRISRSFAEHTKPK